MHIRGGRKVALKNQLWIGSIKDSSNVWHPVIASPDEDLCHRYCQRQTGDEVDPEIPEDGFWTSTYSVELLPIVLSDATLEDEEWLEKDNWEEVDEDADLAEELD
jgi:hypothetical protein